MASALRSYRPWPNCRETSATLSDPSLNTQGQRSVARAMESGKRHVGSKKRTHDRLGLVEFADALPVLVR